MTKKQTVWILLTSVVVLLALAAVLIWFFSPGVHTIGPFLHAEMTADCILLNAEDLSFVEETQFTISLTACGKADGELPKHNGSMELAGHSVKFVLKSGDGRNGFAQYDHDAGLWRLTYSSPAQDGAYPSLYPLEYEVCFFANSPTQMIVKIIREGKSTHIGVLADNLEQAKQIYFDYLTAIR